MKPGDIIKSINGTPLEKNEEFFAFSSQINSLGTRLLVNDRKNATDNPTVETRRDTDVPRPHLSLRRAITAECMVKFFIFVFSSDILLFCSVFGWFSCVRTIIWRGFCLFVLCGLGSLRSGRCMPAGSSVGLFRRFFFNSFWALRCCFLQFIFPNDGLLTKKFRGQNGFLSCRSVFR